MNSFDSNGHSNKVYSPTTEEELQEMLDEGFEILIYHMSVPTVERWKSYEKRIKNG